MTGRLINAAPAAVPSKKRGETPGSSPGSAPAADSEYVTDVNLESRTGIKRATWQKKRLTGDGPPFVKIGSSVRYRLAAVEAWLAERERRSTSDNGGAQ